MPSSKRTEAQRRIKEQYERKRGYWAPHWDDLLKVDPEFLERYLDLSGHPMRDGPLDEKTKELVFVAADASCTTLYRPGIRQHISNALDAGATVGEIVDVLEMVSAIGIHAVTEGVPVLVDETGLPEDVSEADRERQQEIKERFEEDRGYWSELWQEVLEVDQEFFEHYLNYSAHPWRTGALDPKTREFVIIAADASTNHLYMPGLRIHVQNALDYGATREEVMNVIQIASLIGVHTVSESVPILVEEAQKRGLLPESDEATGED